jgi:hypothetical protein
VASDEHEALREEIARQEGVPADFADWVKGHGERELRESAVALRIKLGLGSGAPTVESAIAARERRRQAQAKRLWGES